MIFTFKQLAQREIQVEIKTKFSNSSLRLFLFFNSYAKYS